MAMSKDFEAALRSDFRSMRVLATCSICDQLLYEPWTIACGHTYCYSCLCSWFSQDKRKKSCPECRSKVKVMPAPSFLIKQLVEVILKRSELLLADESVEQHQKKRTEEVTLVDNDRNSTKGLFKGMFDSKQNRLWRDNSDGVLRCSGCGFEHEGGPVCTNCGERIETEEDYDDEIAEGETVELESMGFDLEAESDEDELFNYHDYHHFQNVSNYIDMAYSRRMAANLSHFRPNRDRGEIDLMGESDSEVTEISAASDSSESEMDEEDDSSLQGFIAPEDDYEGNEDGDGEDNNDDDNNEEDDDDQNNDEDEDENNVEDDDGGYESTTNMSLDEQHTYHSFSARHQHRASISDDESDEGGAISNRRQRYRNNRTYLTLETPNSLPSVMTTTGTCLDEAESADHGDQAEMLRYAGWSPLDQGSQSIKQDDISEVRDHNIFTLNSVGESDNNTEILPDRDMSDDNNGDFYSQMGQHNYSRISRHESSTLQSSSHFSGFSESSNSIIGDEDRDTEMSTSFNCSRNSEVQGDPSASSESPTSNQRSSSIEGEIEPQFKSSQRLNSPRAISNSDIHRIRPSSTGGTRRKRNAWESSTQDAAEVESIDAHVSTRRSKAWAISRMRNNYRENGLTSRVRNEETLLNTGSNSNQSITETIGLANVIHDEDEESDDSIQPPSRRHLRRHISNQSSKRLDFAINPMINESQHYPHWCRADKSCVNEPETREKRPDLKSRKIIFYQKNSEANSNGIPNNCVPLSSRIIASLY